MSAQIKELKVIELLQKVMLGEQEGLLPQDSVQKAKLQAQVQSAPKPTATEGPPQQTQ